MRLGRINPPGLQQNMVDKLLKFLLLISPIAYTSGINPEKLELIFFHLGVMGLFIASLYDFPKKANAIPKGVIGILGACILNVAIHSFQIPSLGVLLNVFLFFIGLNIASQYMEKPESYYKYIAIAAIINCAVWLIQTYLINFLPFSSNIIGVRPENGGLFGVTPRLFNYFSIIIPILFSVSPLFLLIPLLSVIGNQYTPIVTTGMTLLSVVKTKKSKAALLSSVAIFGIFFFNHIYKSFQVRHKDIFPQVIIGAAQIPFIGHGLGAYYKTFGSDSFNIILLLGYDLGVLGIMALGYAIWELRKLFKLNVATISLLAVLAVSMIDYVIEIPRLWFTLMFIIAAFITQKKVGEYASN